VVSWFVRITRFGSVHMVRSQDKDMSCAMASIVMVNFKVKKGYMFAGMAAGAGLSVSPIPLGSYIGSTLSQAAIDYAVKSEQEVYKLYEKAKGAAHDFDTKGAKPSLLPQVLQDLGLGQWECVDVGETALAQAIIDATAGGTPVIIACVWDGGGGHALVVDETHSFFGSKYLCVCDPWDGELRIVSCTPGSTVRYDGSYSPISSGTFFGGDAHEYNPSKNNKGKFDGRIIRRK
jgi:hypothetical protein